MQVFEFHFNPKIKEDVVYDSFVYEPENFWERKMGRLYIVGSLSHILPQNLRFLEKLSSLIKKEYYRVTERSSELALKESLRKANESLAEETKIGNVSWLGNLDFAVISLKGNTINFATTGEISLFLLRGGRVTDINQTLRLQEIEPYPLKIFSNVVSGKVALSDRIVALTKEVSDFFDSGKILPEIAKSGEIEEKKVKKIFQSKKEIYSKVSGICLLIDLIEKEISKGRVTIEKKISPFSIWRSLSQLPKEIFVRVKLISKLKIPQVKIKAPKKVKPLSLPVLAPLKIELPSLITRIKGAYIFQAFRKNLYLILFFILIILLGGVLANLERKREIRDAQITLVKVEEKIQSAREAIISRKEKEANLLYQEAWEEIAPLAIADSPVGEEAAKLKTLIESQLLPLNRLEKIDNPEIIFDFGELKFTPQKMVIYGNKLYFFNPLLPNIYKLNLSDKKGDFINFEENFNLAAPLQSWGKVLFFSRPNKLFSFEEGQFGQSFFLRDPYPDYQFNDFSVFKSNLYFLDSKKGEILKYIFNENRIDFQESLWFDLGTERPLEARSLSVDGLVWVLTKDNSIKRYSKGDLQEVLETNFFPYPKNLSKVFTSADLPYLYLLEPAQKRMIILDKSGGIIKQFQSNKFDNLKDFSVLENGKIIYILSGLKVYKIGI